MIELILALLLCAAAAGFAVAAGSGETPAARVPVRDDPRRRARPPAIPAPQADPSSRSRERPTSAGASNGVAPSAGTAPLVVLEPPPVPVPTRAAEPAARSESTAATTLAPTPAVTAPPAQQEHAAPAQDLLPAPHTIRIGRPEPHPDPTRLIQTEVLEPEGLWERILAFSRLLAGVVIFGVLVGLSVIGFFRGVGFFFRKAFGG